MPGGQFKWGVFLLKSNGGVYQGRLSPDGNRARRVKAQAGLTASRILRAVAKAELSEPTLVFRTGEDHQPKVTPGITGWSCPRVPIDGKARHLDVGSP